LHQAPKTKKPKSKDMPKYDLEDRTLDFAVNVRLFIKELPRTISNLEDGKQVVRSSGSVGANYIEANEKLGPKDFGYRLRIARKEAKESVYWLTIIKRVNILDSKDIDNLIKEAGELRKILSAILNKID
jgi:four helix bundle protein